jgi:glycosyltransferase involved in cell wall biosynthesis
MVKLYRLQAKRRALLHQYRAIVTHSDHMLKELIRHGLPGQKAYNFPYYVDLPTRNGNGDFRFVKNQREPSSIESTKEWRLLFCGRMELLKGGRTFLNALPIVAQCLRKPVRAICAGDGRERRAWEKKANRLAAQYRKLKFTFTGWIPRAEMNSLFGNVDLLVVPSLWPEPFGLIGPEAGLSGLPVAAFDVGGISDWLQDGVNGHLAPGATPTPEGLAAAIVACLEDPIEYERLTRNAVLLAQRFSIQNHLEALLGVFETVIDTARKPKALHHTA